MDRRREREESVGSRVLAAVPGVREAMARHPSGRRPAQAPPDPDPDVRVDVDRRLIVLATWEDGCGNGVWCQRCRQEIRDEALRWIRELNAPGGADLPTTAIPTNPWHPELLLGGA